VEQAGAGHAGDVRQRLDLALRQALKARDKVAAAALRSALAAISNAEAVTPGSVQPHGAQSPHVAGTSAGLGAAEAARRSLSDREIAEIIRGEITERETAARDYERRGYGERAARLRLEAEVIAAVS
jgi:uncharacterized protein